MSRIYLLIAIVVLFASCEDENIYINYNVEVELNTQMPHSLNVKVEQGIVGDLVEFFDSRTGKLLYSGKITQSNQERILVNGLEPGSMLNYELLINSRQLQKGAVKLSDLPDEYVKFVSTSIKGTVNLKHHYLLMNKMSEPSGIFLFDEDGKVVWSRLSDSFVKMVKVTKRGTLLSLEDDMGDKFGNANIILETTFAGDTLVHLRLGEGGFDRVAHHDVVLTKRGTYAFITNVNVDGLVVDGITELNALGQKVWEWDMAEYVLPLESGDDFKQPWGNSIAIDDLGNYLLSFRNLSEVWNVNSSNGNVEWKFGKETPMSIVCDFLPINQHHAQWLEGNQLLLFDNGNSQKRTSSRIMRYAFNEEMTSASVVDNVELPIELYSPYMSAVEVMDDNYIVTSSITNTVAEVDGSGKVIWSMAFGDRMFRSQLVYWPLY
ncbi:MAG: aryl-sulfate sulfotransferase [Carboxylicivirga sp.]|jgi:hypothetical protein|nr:aryl-sulfate sulfotransferase [Carboxylicivirga sp.]